MDQQSRAIKQLKGQVLHRFSHSIEAIKRQTIKTEDFGLNLNPIGINTIREACNQRSNRSLSVKNSSSCRNSVNSNSIQNLRQRLLTQTGLAARQKGAAGAEPASGQPGPAGLRIDYIKYDNNQLKNQIQRYKLFEQYAMNPENILKSFGNDNLSEKENKCIQQQIERQMKQMGSKEIELRIKLKSCQRRRAKPKPAADGSTVPLQQWPGQGPANRNALCSVDSNVQEMQVRNYEKIIKPPENKRSSTTS